MDEVGDVSHDDVTFFFCHGIYNTRDSVKTSAELVSEALGGSVVRYGWMSPTLKDCFYDGSSLNQAAIQLLKREIRAELARSSSHRVVMFAHSYGAFLVRSVLWELTPSERRCIEVYAFGGAVVIPRELAAKTQNVFRTTDLTARCGSFMLDRGSIDTNSNIEKIPGRSMRLGHMVQGMFPFLFQAGHHYVLREHFFESYRASIQAVARDVIGRCESSKSAS